MSVFTAPLSDVVLSAITHPVCHPSISLRSLSSHLFLFSPNSQLAPFLCSSPSQIVSSPSLFPPPQFAFCSSLSPRTPLCFSSSDPTLEHLREIRRKLASENLQLKAPVPHLLCRSQLSDRKTFRASWCLREKRAVSPSACLDSLFHASVSREFPACTRAPSPKCEASSP